MYVIHVRVLRVYMFVFVLKWRCSRHMNTGVLCQSLARAHTHAYKHISNSTYMDIVELENLKFHFAKNSFWIFRIWLSREELMEHDQFAFLESKYRNSQPRIISVTFTWKEGGIHRLSAIAHKHSLWTHTQAVGSSAKPVNWSTREHLASYELKHLS